MVEGFIRFPESVGNLLSGSQKVAVIDELIRAFSLITAEFKKVAIEVKSANLCGLLGRDIAVWAVIHVTSLEHGCRAARFHCFLGGELEAIYVLERNNEPTTPVKIVSEMLEDVVQRPIPA